MIYVIMFGDSIFERVYYTDEEEVSRRVEKLREMFNGRYWYVTLESR